MSNDDFQIQKTVAYSTLSRPTPYSVRKLEKSNINLALAIQASMASHKPVYGYSKELTRILSTSEAIEILRQRAEEMLGIF